jgi:hypothetical protein
MMTNPVPRAWLFTPEGQRYSQFVRGMHSAVVDFETDSEEFATDNPQKIREDHTALAESNSVGSKVILSSNMHKPVLDLDMDAMLLPSTTPKHHHLYINAEMTWHEYSLLLNVLGHVGILQAGYVRASHARGESFVRLPWIRK